MLSRLEENAAHRRAGVLARAGTQIKSQPISQRSDEAQCREEVSGELVVAGGDASEVLEATEAALDHVAAFVDFLS